jgi:hypothetical protein
MPNAWITTARLRETEARIAYIEAHPAFSSWLKDALRSAMTRSPVDVINDLEILSHVLRNWASASIDLQRVNADSSPAKSER